MYVVKSTVKALVKKHGKRIGKSYWSYLDRRIEGIVERDCLNTRQATLNSEDGAAADELSKLRRK